MTLLKHPDIDGVSLFVAPPGPHEHGVHAHDAYSVIVLTEGCKDFHHEGRTHRVEAHQIAVANPGELHGCGPVDGGAWAHKTWYVSQEVADALSGSPGPRLRDPVVCDTGLAQALIHAHDIALSGDTRDRESLSLDALMSLFDAHGDARRKPSTRWDGQRIRIGKYAVFTDANIEDAFQLSELANIGGVSRTQVVRDFRDHYGSTPGEWLRHRRAEAAKRLIGRGMDLSEAAIACGFSDQSHMSRVFKGLYGFAPSAVQNAATDAAGPVI